MIEVPSEGSPTYCVTNTKKPFYRLRCLVNRFLPDRWKREIYVIITGTTTLDGPTPVFDVGADITVTGSVIPDKQPCGGSGCVAPREE
jgi:hypothetical protein